MADSSTTDVGRWLRGKPLGVARAIATRAALRAAPGLGQRDDSRSLNSVDRAEILSAFRDLAACWSEVRYGIHTTVDDERMIFASSNASTAARNAAAAARGLIATPPRANVDLVRVATESAAECALWAAAPRGKAARTAMRSVVEADVRLVEFGNRSRELAGRPLWPAGIHKWAREHWMRLKLALQAADEDWEVWIEWYEGRLKGAPTAESLENMRVRTIERFWKEGPKVANAEIKRLSYAYEGRVAPDGLPLANEQILQEIVDFCRETGFAESTFGRRAVNDGKLTSRLRNNGRITTETLDRIRAFISSHRGWLGTDLQLGNAPPRPPSVSLPSPSPATRFAFANGRFDVVPPTAWQSHRADAARYHTKARILAGSLADRLDKTDAVPDIAGSVSALLDVLGNEIADVQPDQLRLASRSIGAKARVYGHPAAQWEISAESVSAFFELADVLTDLQSFARTEIEAHENAIRELDLTPQNVAEAKAGLDFVSEGVLASQDIISERVEISFESATEVSDTASDEQVKVAVEGDRTLLTANLALAVARQLGRDAEEGPAQGVGGPPDKPPQSEPPGRRPEKPERPKRWKRAGRAGASGERSWDDFADRVMTRIHKKGPDALADATIQAAASAIKHAPKTAAALGAALVVWSMSNPIVLAGGGIAATIAWIGYELRRRNAAGKK